MRASANVYEVKIVATWGFWRVPVVNSFVGGHVHDSFESFRLYILHDKHVSY